MMVTGRSGHGHGQRTPRPALTTNAAIAAVVALSLAAAPQVAAQTYVLSFNEPALAGNGTPIPTTYGSVPGQLSVANSAYSVFGNNPVATGLCHWSAYGAVANVAYTCSAGAGVSGFTFTPASGYRLFLESLDVGEYLDRVGQDATVRVYDLAFNQLFTQAATLSGSANSWHVTPGVASESGLVLQYGDSWDFGASNITVRLERIGDVSVVPEPGTVGLLATGLLGLAGVAVRRRRRA